MPHTRPARTRQSVAILQPRTDRTNINDRTDPNSRLTTPNLFAKQGPQIDPPKSAGESTDPDRRGLGRADAAFTPNSVHPQCPIAVFLRRSPTASGSRRLEARLGVRNAAAAHRDRGLVEADAEERLAEPAGRLGVDRGALIARAEWRHRAQQLRVDIGTHALGALAVRQRSAPHNMIPRPGFGRDAFDLSRNAERCQRWAYVEGIDRRQQTLRRSESKSGGTHGTSP